MQVRMLKTMVGPNVNRPEGKIVNVPDAEAKNLIKGGIAEAFVIKPKEKAARTEKPQSKPRTSRPITASGNSPDEGKSDDGKPAENKTE